MKRLRCLIGFHKWNGCQCLLCNTTRDTKHDWDACICHRCGTIKPYLDESHDWDGCICTKCGLTKSLDHPAHKWDGCKCQKCGSLRNKGHKIPKEECRCIVCGHFEHDFVFSHKKSVTTDSVKASPKIFYRGYYLDIYTCRHCDAVEERYAGDWDSEDPEFD